MSWEDKIMLHILILISRNGLITQQTVYEWIQISKLFLQFIRYFKWMWKLFSFFVLVWVLDENGKLTKNEAPLSVVYFFRSARSAGKLYKLWRSQPKFSLVRYKFDEVELWCLFCENCYFLENWSVKRSFLTIFEWQGGGRRQKTQTSALRTLWTALKELHSTVFVYEKHLKKV